MPFRNLPKNSAFVAVVALAVGSGLWHWWHTQREAAIGTLKAHVPPAFVIFDTLAHCSQGGLSAIDERVIFTASLSSPQDLEIAAGQKRHREWVAGAIPRDALYNETTTFICPGLPAALEKRMLSVLADPRNMRRHGEYSLFYLPVERVLVVRRYND